MAYPQVFRWTDEQFDCWLAGLFDGEGCIHIPKVPGIDLSIASTDAAVIDAVHERLGVGHVQEILYSRQEWKPKYHWRVRNYGEAAQVLHRIRPYLTIKAAKADEALARIENRSAKWRDRAERNAAIVDLVRQGVRRVDIGLQFDLTSRAVDYIIRVAENRQRSSQQGRRVFISNFVKAPVAATTSVRLLA